MNLLNWALRAASSLALACAYAAAPAADYPAPKEGDAVLRDFRFHTGEVIPELKLTDLGLVDVTSFSFVPLFDPK